MAFWSCKMYFGMRRSGRKIPVPSHKSFCFRTGDPGFTSRVDGWAPSWGFFWSSAFGLVCAAAGDWSLELLPGGGVWLNAVDAKNKRKKAQRRVIDLPLSPNGEHAVGRSPETQAVTRDIGNCSVGPPCPARRGRRQRHQGCNLRRRLALSERFREFRPRSEESDPVLHHPRDLRNRMLRHLACQHSGGDRF